MGLRYRKSINIGKGARVNLSRSGIGCSFGTNGARITKRSSVGWSGTVGIPGSGISYTRSIGSKRRSGNGSIIGGLFSAFASMFCFILWLTWQAVKWICIAMFYFCKHSIIAIGWCIDMLAEGGRWIYHYIREKYNQHKQSPQ